MQKTMTLDPVAFREVCVSFLEHWDEIGEPGEAIDESMALEWFLDELQGSNAHDATVRFLATIDALEEPPLCEFVASADEGYETLHVAVFESAARAPMGEDGKIDTAWMARDVGVRVAQIETLERLLGG